MSSDLTESKIAPLCVIALGGNTGNTAATFLRAAELLKHGGFTVRRVSSSIVTEPEGMAPGTPPFLNAVLSGYWSGTPEELLALCRRIEEECGRPNDHIPYTDRTLDLDIILFGDLRMETERLTIPHPRAHLRSFVMDPLEEIEPDLKRCFFEKP